MLQVLSDIMVLLETKGELDKTGASGSRDQC